MLFLNVIHRFHRMGGLHVTAMNVKEQQDRTCSSHRREKPGCPARLQSTPRSLKLNESYGQHNNREDFVLEILAVVRHGIPQALGPERPDLCVAKHQKEKANGEETQGPDVVRQGPSFCEVTL